MNNPRITEVRDTDWRAEDGKIAFKAVNSGDWTPHFQFNEDQRNPNFDDDGCACYDAQKVVDAQIDALIGTFPNDVVHQLLMMGFFVAGLDGQPHFHSSPRFTECMTGNGVKGNSMPECFDAIRKYGMVPWNALPFTPTMTQEEYFAPVPQPVLDTGKQFLALMGGKNFLQYHWIINGGTKNIAAMKAAILQAPLSLGIAVTDGWNQETPVDPPANAPVVHSVACLKIVDVSCGISDNYPPYMKWLDAGYPIPYVLQAVVSPIFAPETPIPPAPQIALTPMPSNSTISTWLSQVAAWLRSLLQNPKP